MSIDQLLKSAFQLAYFIHPDKQTAIDITLAAVDRLEVASEAQDKRIYYRPTGRVASRASRTRISLSKKHLLQRLVYIESEPYERLEELRPDALSQQVLLIYFIKHLVRIVIKRNSFYVLLGLSRLLCNYSTAETMGMYSFLVQDPDRIRDDTYYRMRKRQLMQEMENRFGALIRTHKNQRREVRFQSQECTDDYLRLTKNCLIRFTPWDTQCVLPNSIDPSSSFVDDLLFKGSDPDDEHAIETNRIHTVLHPDCYNRLVTLLGLDLPDQRIEIPFFFIPGNTPPASGDRNAPPALEETDIDQIKEILNERARRRRKTSGELLSILVDGEERAQWNLHQASRIQLEIEDGSELIELRRSGKHGELSVANFLLEYGESGITAAHQDFVLRGQKLSFDISVPKSSVDQAPNALITIEHKESNPIRRALVVIRHLREQVAEPFSSRGWTVTDLIKSPLVLAVVTCVAILAIYLRIQTNHQNRQKEMEPEQSASSENRNGSFAARPPVNREPTTNQNLKAPAPETPADKRGGAKTAGEGEPVTDSKHPRSLGLEEKSASLKTVKQIYIDPFGTDDSSRRVRDLLMEALQTANHFTVVKERDQADAVVEGVAKPASTNTAKIDLAVQLVNGRGEVIWPLVQKKRYAGDVAEVVSRVVRDLLDDIERLDRKH